VLEGALRERIRTIIRQVCKELGVQILSGVLSREHVHMFVEIPPHIAVRNFARRVKGRSSQRSNLSRSARPPGPLDLARAPRKLIFSPARCRLSTAFAMPANFAPRVKQTLIKYNVTGMIRSQHENRKPFAPNSLKIPTRQHRCNKAPHRPRREYAPKFEPTSDSHHCADFTTKIGIALAAITTALISARRQ
jgi:hypothetical protein